MSLDALLFQPGGRCFYCGQPLRRRVWAEPAPWITPWSAAKRSTPTATIAHLEATLGAIQRGQYEQFAPFIVQRVMVWS